MKVLVTGVAGQLGHDVMNEVGKRKYEGGGADPAPASSGIAGGTAGAPRAPCSLGVPARGGGTGGFLSF